MFKFIFEQQLGLDWKYLTEIQEVEVLSESSLLINYSATAIKQAIWIKNSNYFSHFQMDTIPSFQEELIFSSDSASSFDLFAAVFYLLARVEEYGENNWDEHGRFPSSQSILSQKDLLSIPVVDKWVGELRKEVEKKSGQSLIPKIYKFISTLDIDHIYAYKGKSTLVTLGALAKDVVRLKARRLIDRLKAQDPYDRLENILQWHEQVDLIPQFFVLTASRGPYDKNLSPQSNHFHTQILQLSTKAPLGIHPSYQSSKDWCFDEEKGTLENIIKQPVHQSRQHFLRLRFPATYRSLIAAEIKEDYSMGYPDVLGHRAGTCSPFFWYDLEKDEETELMIFPFQLMDVTMKNYLKYDPETALKAAKRIVDSVKEVNGTCCLIWHNSSFYEEEGWAGWEAVYREILSLASA